MIERRAEYTKKYKQTLLKFFLQYIVEKGYTQRQFARAIGYTDSWLSQCKHGKEELPDSIAWGIEQYDRAEDYLLEERRRLVNRRRYGRKRNGRNGEGNQ